jgi:hypothetical protein
METQSMEAIKGRKKKQRRGKARQEFRVISWHGTTAAGILEHRKYFSYNETVDSPFDAEWFAWLHNYDAINGEEKQ